MSTEKYPASFILSEKNKKMLCGSNGFLYHSGKGDVFHRLWRCEQRSCNGTACTEPEDGFVIWEKAHNHEPQRGKAEYKSLISEAKSMADQEAGPSTRQIIQNVSVDLSNEAIEHMPMIDSLKRTV